MEEQDTNAELEEAKEKLEALEKQIEGLQSGVGTALVQISQKAESEIHFGGDVSNIVHWLDENDIPLGCEFITDTIDARIAFAGAANTRASTDAPIMHGDFLVLRCNSDTIDPNDPNPDPRSDCYYIGLCVENCMLDQETPVDSNFSHTAAAAGDFDARHFVAWKTCGGEGGETEGHTGQVIVETGTTVTKTESSPDEDGCRDITIQVQTNRTGLNFVDGLLTGNPAVTAESADIETFTFKAGCGEVDLCTDPWPETITVEISGQPTGSWVTDGTHVLYLIQGANVLDIHNGIINATYGSNGNTGQNQQGNIVHNIEVVLDGVGQTAYIALNQTSIFLSQTVSQATTSFNCELPITFTFSAGATAIVKL